MSQIRCMKCMQTYDEQYDICPHCGYKRGMESANPLYLPEGIVLEDKYLIGAAIGHGGFGITYIALDQLLDKRVAIKEYFPASLSTRTIGDQTIYPFTTQDADNNYRYGREKFIEEARTLAKFSGMESIVSILTCFTQNNTAYIVMEYLEGEDLLEYVKKRGGKIGWEETLTLLAPVMDALIALHAQGLIHRDISPDNIFVTKGGKTKLLDFGTARFAMGEKSKSLSVILKPGYAPPEQYSSRGKQGPWTDVYALAATIYRCVTGQAPADAVDRQMGTDIELPSSLGVNIPEEAEDALMRALVLELKNRVQTIEELRTGLHDEAQTDRHTARKAEQVPVDLGTESVDPEFFKASINAEYKSESPEESENPEQSESILSMANKKRRRGLIAAIAVVVIAGVLCACFAGSVTSISLSVTYLDMKVGDTATLYAYVSRFLQGTSLESVYWYYDGDFIAVNNDGTVTASGEGDTTIVAEAYNSDKRAYCTVHAEYPIVTIGGKDIKVNETTLDISNSGIYDVTVLADFISLQSIDLSGNPISDIEPLASLSTLEEINISNTDVSDVTVLAALPNLKILNLAGTAVTDLSQLSDDIYIESGQRSYSISVTYGSQILMSDADFGLNVGDREIAWSSNDSDFAAVGEIAAVTNVQHDPTQGYQYAEIVGTVGNTDITLTYIISLQGTSYTFSWSDDRVDLSNCNCYPLIIDPMIDDCYGFTVTFSSTASEGNPYGVKWQIYIKDDGGHWVSVGTVYLEEGVEQTVDIVLDEPISFSQITILPNGSNIDYARWGTNIELTNLVFAQSQ